MPSRVRLAPRAATWTLRDDSGCSASRCQRLSASRAAAVISADDGFSASANRLAGSWPDPPSSRSSSSTCRCGHVQRVGAQPVQQPDLLESVRAGGDLLGCGAQTVRVVAAAGAADRLQRGQRRVRLEDLAALGELPQQHGPQPVQAAAPGQFPGQFGRRLHGARPDQFDGQPHPEQAQPGQQVLPFDLGDLDRARPVRRTGRRSAAAGRPPRAAPARVWPAPGTPARAASRPRARAARPPARSPGTAGAAGARPGSAGRPVRPPPARPAGTSRSRRRGTARRPRSSGCRAPGRRRGTTRGTGRRWRGCAAAGTARRRPPAAGRPRASAPAGSVADRSVEIDAMPGVSIRVISASRLVGQDTSSRSMSRRLPAAQVDVQRAGLPGEVGDLRRSVRAGGR